MALFGFNKQKVLATAEKYVQQGKLQNAISEYEKILKNDAKDLTVTNTVGDLYSRIGESDKATLCFKAVGDAYAAQGFTVKAIAMYKKICKLQPSLESLLKLAELYTQQGLFNDARAQYLQVAEEFLKSGELENAVRIFQKILEMDPENSTMRVRLAEVYIRLGKKADAWQIFTSAAESLRAKGSLQAADEVLQRMLTLDPANTYALQMQGKNLLESGDAAGAVTTLSKIPDIDSNPDALKDLLKAYLQTGQLSDAGTVANKLLTVHNDLAAIASFADALMQAGQYENALTVFDQHAERLLAENSDKVLENLHTIIGHVRDNTDSLQKLLDLFHKAGETTHIGEVIELLAHASVQSGDLGKARDLYQKLATIEPQNPLHMQNYQQVVSQLGGNSGGKMITPEEAVVLIDDLEATAPSVHQHYSDEVALAVRSALTDAELFISYNMPAKALGPLVTALPMAPRDLRLNQRLAALHTRAGRFAEAGICCRTLQSVYSDADHPDEATRYGELAERYEERSSAPVHPIGQDEEHVFLDAGPQVSEGEHAVAEFSIDESSAAGVDEESAEQSDDEGAVTGEAASPWPAATGAKKDAQEDAEEIKVEAGETEFAVVDEAAASAEASATSTEIDLSSEWDDSVTVEADESAAEPPEAEVAAAPVHEAADSAVVDETVEEIRFYLEHSMAEQAMAALAKLATQTNDQAKLAELRAEVDAATVQPAEEEVSSAEPAFEELTADDIPSAEAEVGVEAEPEAAVEVEEAPAPVEEPAAEFAVEEAHVEAQVEAPEVEGIKVEEPVVEEPAVEEVVAAAPPAPVAKTPVVAKAPVKAVPAPVAEPEPEPELEPATGVLKEFVTDLESSLGDGFLPGTVATSTPAAAAPPKPAAPARAPISQPAQPAVAAAQSAPVLGEFVADIESSLGEDFLQAAPKAVPQAPAPVAKAQPVAAPPPPVPVAPVVAPLAASAAASASPAAPSAPVVPAASWPAPSVELGKPKTQASPLASAPAPAAGKSPFSEDAGVDLAEMFGELKQDLEAGVAASDEDPETHYNLGIAFREMGLLDEAIGELQKAVQSFDRGHPFPQIMQSYTWLAQCFLEKGVPEAAVRWYEKALAVPGIDGETRVALNYELGGAYEAAGDKPTALKHFTSVYSSNIDYRDVSERIKALKS